MSVARVTISIDESLLKRIDRLVSSNIFPSRSQAIQEAVAEKVSRFDKTRLAQECAKLDKAYEQAVADESLGVESEEWPAY